MWIRLMSAGDRAHWKVLESIVNHVEGDILQLVRHRQGVRCVNALIEHFLSFDAPKVASIRRALVREEEALCNLICHDFANHTIQLIAEYETEAIAKAIKKNFVVIAVSEFGNFVMSKCISADAYTGHINDFSELFESNSDEILRINKNAHTGIKVVLDDAQWKLKQYDIVRHRCSRNSKQTPGCETEEGKGKGQRKGRETTRMSAGKSFQ
jgi:hypothetical protein